MAAADETVDIDEGDRRDHPVVTRLPENGLVVDLGRQSERRIRGLKRGEGELARQVQAVVQQSRESLGIEDGLEIVPVVLLYRCGAPSYVVITPDRNAES
jgi:hypothetical protein